MSILSLNWHLRYKRKEVIDGISIKRLPYSYNKFAGKILSLLITIPYFLFHINSFKTILVYGPMSGLYGIILSGKLFNKQVIFQSVNYGADDIETLAQNSPLAKAIFKHLGGYFALSPAFTSSFRRIYKGNDNLIFESPQGVDTNRFYPIDEEEKLALKKRLNLPVDKQLIITVGNLIERKGYREIFNVLNETDKDFLYLIIGNYKTSKEFYFWQDESEMNDLHALGKRLLGDKITFSGKKDNVDEYLKAADILLLNSVNEGLPNSILEAMACGTVPVFKEIEGLSSYIAFQNKNAIVFNNPEELKAAVVKVLDQEELRKEMAHNASLFIRENCSFDIVTYKFIQHFNL